MEMLRKYAADYGFLLTDQMLGQFRAYMELLLEWNGRMNLTAITAPEDVYVKHFLDSLLLLKAVDPPEGALMIDVGTGAGFPGIPVKIVRPDLQLTLLDCLKKRVDFLRAVSDAVGQNNNCVHGRAEELGRKVEFREQFDVATARAVAVLPVLCEYCLPFVKVGGHFVALKGYDVEDEVAGAARALQCLGAVHSDTVKCDLPLENRRALVVFQKRSQTSTKYPRVAVKITKSPL